MKEKKANNKMHWFFYVVFAVLIVYCISLMFPLIWGLITSLKNPGEFLNGNVIGLPSIEKSSKELLFKNYITLIENYKLTRTVSFYGFAGIKTTHSTTAGLFDTVINSIIYSFGGAFILTIVPCVTAYLVQKYNFKFSIFIYNVALFSMIIPSVGAYPAEIALLRNLGLYDNFLGNFVQKMHFVGRYFFVFTAFFSMLSNGYSEAAEIDGASQLRILLSIALPLSAKIIFTIFLLEFVGLWNDYNTPLLYLPTHPTLAYGIHYMVYNMSSHNINNTPVKVSASMFLAIPMLIVFIIFKDKIMGNISMGGLKE